MFQSYMVKRLLFLIIALTPAILSAAGYKYRVQVVDSLSNEPIPYAALFIKDTGSGTLTDDNGRAELGTTTPSCTIIVTLMVHDGVVVPSSARPLSSVRVPLPVSLMKSAA